MTENIGEDMRELDNKLIKNMFFGGFKLNEADMENYKRLK